MNKYFLLMATAICVLLFGSCNDDDEQYPEPIPISAKKVDMTVVVPIHLSSLEYFDYVISYYDNNGLVHIDTIRKENYIDDHGLVQIDTIRKDNYSAKFKEDFSTKKMSLNDCYIRIFRYDNMILSCTTTVELLPKGDYETLGSFIFYIPKPYIFPSEYDSATPNQDDVASQMPEDIESISIDSMLLSDFLTTYGTLFSSQCVIKNSMVGYEIFFY